MKKETLQEIQERYELGKAQLAALLDENLPEVTNDANASALFMQLIPDINWVGFYSVIEDKLVLGPFQGLPACSILPYGKGVCWKAVLDEKPLYVEDVHQFEGHIACDRNSNSELVIPLFKDGKVVKVLDIDSPVVNRFSQEEIKKINELADLLNY